MTHRADAVAPFDIGDEERGFHVDTVFEVGDGSAFQQMDEVFRQTRHAIPDGTVPIARDSAGNLFLLFLDSSNHVSFWDHERFAGDNDVKLVETIDSFLERVKSPR